MTNPQQHQQQQPRTVGYLTVGRRPPLLPVVDQQPHPGHGGAARPRRRQRRVPVMRGRSRAAPAPAVSHRGARVGGAVEDGAGGRRPPRLPTGGCLFKFFRYPFAVRREGVELMQVREKVCTPGGGRKEGGGVAWIPAALRIEPYYIGCTVELRLQASPGQREQQARARQKGQVRSWQVFLTSAAEQADTHT